MRKSSQKVIKEELIEYLKVHDLEIVSLSKQEALNTSYEAGFSVILSNSVKIGRVKNDLDSLILSHSELSKNDLFFDFLKWSHLDEKVKTDDFIEFLKNTLPQYIVFDSEKNKYYHLKLYHAISEETYLAFLARPSYLVDIIAHLPSSLFKENANLFDKVFNLAINIKAFNTIDFQVKTYKFLKDNKTYFNQYEKYFNLIDINQKEDFKMTTSPLETIKIDIDLVYLSTFNLNKNYSLTQISSLIEYFLSNVNEKKDLLNLDEFNYYQKNKKWIAVLSAENLNQPFHENFFKEKLKYILSQIDKKQLQPNFLGLLF